MDWSTIMKIPKEDMQILKSRSKQNLKKVDSLLSDPFISDWARQYWTKVRDHLVINLSELGELKNSNYVH